MNRDEVQQYTTDSEIINAKPISKVTFYRWCSEGNIDSISSFIEENKNGKVFKDYGWVPIIIACRRNNLKLVELFLNSGVPVNKPDSTYVSSLLHTCSLTNSSGDLIEMLISKGADIEATDINGRTPLYVAIEENNIEAAKSLLSNGANIYVIEQLDLETLSYYDIETNKTANYVLKVMTNIN